ncbi:MAG: hypothetical protein CML17_07585 [Pusillimonas sp.]|nr:hypothetical protein [Pusillimonas sp.]
MSNLAITNGHIITMNAADDIHTNGTLLIENQKIVDILAANAPVPEHYEKIDASGCVVLPGLINAHSHLYSTFGRSVSFDQDLIKWLTTQKNLIAQFDDEDFDLCIEVGIALNIKSGNTCVVDAMALPNDSGNSRYARALALGKQYKLQYVLARAYTDQMVSPEYIESLDTIETLNSQLIEQYHEGRDGRIQIQMSPNLPWGLSAEGFKLTRRLANKYQVGIQMHTSESHAYADLIEKAFGHRSNIKVYEDGECLGPDVQLLSCAHLTAEEFETLKRTGTRVILDPISNTTLGTGNPPTTKVINSGVPTALATNGMASAGGQDMFEAMKTLVSLARTETFDPATISAYRALQMATIEGAKALMLDKQIGSLEKGKIADVICVDVATLYHAPALDTIATLVFACSSRDVKHVFLKGEKAVVNHTLTLADEKTLVKKIEQRAAAALERSRAQGQTKG